MSRFPASRTDPAAYDHTVELPVFYNDLDPNRHLNNVALGRFFEHARVVAHRGLRPLNGSGGSGGSGGAGAVHVLVARVAIDYLAEGRFGSPLTVGTRLASVGRSSLVEEQAAWQDGACIALCEVVLVRVDGSGPTPWSEELRAELQQLVAVPPS